MIPNVNNLNYFSIIESFDSTWMLSIRFSLIYDQMKFWCWQGKIKGNFTQLNTLYEILLRVFNETDEKLFSQSEDYTDSVLHLDISLTCLRFNPKSHDILKCHWHDVLNTNQCLWHIERLRRSTLQKFFSSNMVGCHSE